MQLMGLIALSDPPRADSISLISELKTLGVRTVMVTGDAPATAAIVAHAVGLDGAVCPPGAIPDGVKPTDFAVFAGILPEGKFNLVKAFQKNGHTVGMCGDGANDAPALRQAQMGIAVSTATDVAKSAAGIVPSSFQAVEKVRGMGSVNVTPSSCDLAEADGLPAGSPDLDRHSVTSIDDPPPAPQSGHRGRRGARAGQGGRSDDPRERSLQSEPGRDLRHQGQRDLGGRPEEIRLKELAVYSTHPARIQPPLDGRTDP
jgi:hypothetical protein